MIRLPHLFFIFFLMIPILPRGLPAAPSFPWEHPLSILDFQSGRYVVAGKIQTQGDGTDFLVFYPESEREFQIPLRGLSAQKAIDLQSVAGLFQVRLPWHPDGRRKGWFYFEKFLGVASFEDLYQHPVKKH